jgi:Phospholipase/Carboxylesterase
MGMRMTGWFDIASLDEISQREDVQGLKDSMQQVEQLVREEQSQGIDK